VINVIVNNAVELLRDKYIIRH